VTSLNSSCHKASESTLISVIIPALNEADMIGGCLESLSKSDYPKSKFEVVVADNGSTDATLEIAQSYASRLQLTILRKPGLTVSSLRNQGAAIAQGEILAFLDADCVVLSDWLQNAERYLTKCDSGIVGGSITIPHDSRWVARVWYGFGYAPRNGDVSYVPSGNLLLRRSSLVELGGFSDELRTAEDFDLCLRARGAGLPVRGVAEMAVLHLRTPQTLWQFYSRERWHGAHVGKALWRNIGNWADFRACAFALYMLLCSLGIVSGLGRAWLTQQYGILYAAVAATLAGGIAGSLFKLRTVRGHNRNWLAFSQLIVLHIVFGMARARALISMQTVYPRSEISS
jgi:glycosyltransferase involved in cell wall biosynthesis